MLFRKKASRPFAEEQIGVLFVCMGNICRSPAGEGVFKHYVSNHGKENLFYIDSAGTTGHHAGGEADPRMQQAARQRGYVLESIARKVVDSDLEYYDLILAMDFENLMHLRSMKQKEELPHVRLLGSFLPDAIDDQSARSVPDPYYGGMDGFEQVLDMIEQACPNIYQHCLEIKNV